MKYIYVNSTNKETGKPTERGLYRSGEIVELANLGTGKSLLIRYEDETATATSMVGNVSKGNGRLVVETMNTVYEFDEVLEK